MYQKKRLFADYFVYLYYWSDDEERRVVLMDE